jgi:hypothetical protein
MAMQTFTITGRVRETEQSSYTNKSSGEVIEKRQLSLDVPGMRESVLVEFDLEHAPKDDLLDQWELDEAWVVVGAESMRALAFNRRNPRPGESSLSAMVVFRGVEARPVTADERRSLQTARKQQKQQEKARRAQRRAEREQERAAQTTPADQASA